MHAVETQILEIRGPPAAPALPLVKRSIASWSSFTPGSTLFKRDALQEGGLIPRLRQARAVVQDALANPFAKQRLADGLAKHRNLDPSDAYVEAEKVFAQIGKRFGCHPDETALD